MIKIKVIDNVSFASEFERCCTQYSSLKMATAWCGDPSHTLPYSYLSPCGSKLKLELILGISFNQTHPDAIQHFLDKKIDIKVFRAEVCLFHPKFYLFKKRAKFALFVGSTNFTYSGFYNNTEVNILLEGGESEQIKNAENLFRHWKSDDNSFVPTKKWLREYEKTYHQQRVKERKNRIATPRDSEERISTSNWLSQARWSLYLQKVKDGLAEKEYPESKYSDVLDATKDKLPLPWEITVFDQLENRKIIGGMKGYSKLGHVAASGAFRHFMLNGSKSKKRTAVDAINNICNLATPLEYTQLKQHLNKLVKIGPTIKVWSRVLTILRPDVFCTVASPSVRSNLSQTLQIPQTKFATVDGYVSLLELIHSCPWYNSPMPATKTDQKIWSRRAAFMDAIFY